MLGCIRSKFVGAQHAAPLQRPFHFAVLVALLLIFSGCGATAVQIIPTARPTATETPTDAPTRTPARDVTPTISPTSPPMTATGGPSPTPLFGATRTSVVAATSDQTSLNPNAPRIEFFTSDAAAVAPGSTVTLYWSTRGARDAVIYQLERGVRNRLWNVGPDGSLPVQTSRSDRGTVDFVLSVGEGSQYTEQNALDPAGVPGCMVLPAAAGSLPDRLGAGHPVDRRAVRARADAVDVSIDQPGLRAVQ